MKKENKVLLKVLVEKEQKKMLENVSKEREVSEATVVRSILSDFIMFKRYNK